jgi:ABC-type multidrug transport system fused ATPase/permease subunit
MLLSTFAVGQVLLSMLYFFVFFIWIILLFHVFVDIFRSHDLGGVAKTLWILFVILMPFLGVFVYVIARGKKMTEHAAEQARAQDTAMRGYIQDAAGTTSTADELTKLADLKDRGVISDDEYQQLKAKALAS